MTDTGINVPINVPVNKFEKQLARANATAQKELAALKRRFKDYNGSVKEDVGGSAVAAKKGLTGLFNVSARGRFVIQNTANQFGDLAVQIGGGQSAARALSQQLPQLLGAFGAMGAVMGTVAAIGIPLGTALIRNGRRC